MIQRSISDRDNNYEIQRVKFDIDKFDEDLAKRASLETRLLMDNLPIVSNDFISPYDEADFQIKFSEENPKKFCLYLLCKIYHWIRIMHNIQIKKMYGTFFKDSNFFYFTNCKIIEFKIKDPEIEQKLKKNKKMNEGVMSEKKRRELIQREKEKMEEKAAGLRMKHEHEKMMQKMFVMQNENFSFNQFNYNLQEAMKKDKEFLNKRNPNNYKNYLKGKKGNTGEFKNFEYKVIANSPNLRVKRMKVKRNSVMISLKGNSVNELFRSEDIFKRSQTEKRRKNYSIGKKKRSKGSKDIYEEYRENGNEELVNYFESEEIKKNDIRRELKMKEDFMRKRDENEQNFLENSPPRNQKFSFTNPVEPYSNTRKLRFSVDSSSKNKYKKNKFNNPKHLSQSINLEYLKNTDKLRKNFLQKNLKKIFGEEKERNSQNSFQFFTKMTHRKISEAEKNYMKFIEKLKISNPLNKIEKESNKQLIEAKKREKSITNIPRYKMKMSPGKYEQASKNTLKSLLLMNYSQTRQEDDDF